MSADAASERRRMVVLRDASQLLDVPESTLRRLCAKGVVPAEKVGRGWRVKGAYIDDVTSWARPAEVAS